MSGKQTVAVSHRETPTPCALRVVAALGSKCPTAHAELTASADVPAGRAVFAGEQLPEWQAAARLAAALGVQGSEADVQRFVPLAEKIAAAPAEAFVELNEALKPGPYVLGAHVSAADAVLFAAALEGNRFDVREHGKKAPAVAKWFQGLKHNADLKALFAAPKKAASDENKGIAGNKGKVSVGEGADGQTVVTRFPPEPSGYMHIGHIKAALLNDFCAHVKNKGRLIVRFDDTNPAKERPEFYDSILSDLTSVGITPDSISYTSDHFDTLIAKAEQLIREGNGYVDDSPREDVKRGRAEGTESPARSYSVERNLELWDEMKRGTEHGMLCILRGKIDMQSTNRVLRDPSLYRCIASPAHHRTGLKYKVYPLYDFSIPIVDSIEGVTHALRSSEFHDRNALYDWVVDTLHLRKPIIDDFSRLNFAYVLLSKRKLQWFVDHGVVEDWMDPRFPTVRGLLRRGLTVEAMREFVQSQGSSKSLNLMDMDKLWVINKRLIDPAVPRYTGVSAERAATMHSTNRVLRDPSLYRCIASPAHHRTGLKYKVYPLYDFSIPIVDSIEGVTHALRSSEFHDRNALYDWVVDTLHLRKPIIDDFSRLNFAYVLLSKRKLQWFVDHGVVEDWMDPRFPTVRGLLRRGLTVEAMREFVQSQGSSKSLNLMDMDKLWVINKRLIDPAVPRYTGVSAERAATMHVAGAPVPAEAREVACHKKNPALGAKKVWFGETVLIDAEDAAALSAGEEVTLMDWGNVVVDEVSADRLTIRAHLHLEGSVKSTEKKLTWLCNAAGAQAPVEVSTIEYDHLLTVPKIPEYPCKGIATAEHAARNPKELPLAVGQEVTVLAEASRGLLPIETKEGKKGVVPLAAVNVLGANWEEFIRPVTKVVSRVYVSPDVAAFKVGQKCQLERRGYFICDGDRVLNMIPDGSSKAMLGQKIVLKWN
eukprot:m51a1_g11303 putative glutamyl-trna synthetase (935) ;mRNA; f:73748-77188